MEYKKKTWTKRLKIVKNNKFLNLILRTIKKFQQVQITL
jgi:hypothetical protein